jgi:hypothetical protein
MVHETSFQIINIYFISGQNCDSSKGWYESDMDSEEHFDDISCREPFGKIRVAFYKIRSVPSKHKVFVFTLAILFDEAQLDQLP